MKEATAHTGATKGADDLEPFPGCQGICKLLKVLGLKPGELLVSFDEVESGAREVQELQELLRGRNPQQLQLVLRVVRCIVEPSSLSDITRDRHPRKRQDEDVAVHEAVA